jgi:hypothetical protein
LRQEVILPSRTAEGALVFPFMRGVSFTGVVCAALAALFLAPPSEAISADLTFAPQIDYTEGSLEVGLVSQTNENTKNGNGARSTGTQLHETINLAADGHVYHPRFFRFHTMLAGGLYEESTSGNLVSTYRNTEHPWNYELRGIFLPEHPYNLELFTIHQESTLPSTFLRAQTGSFDMKGANFTYQDNPYFFHASYVDTVNDSSSGRVDSKTYRANGSHVGTTSAESAAYSHTDSVSSSGLVVTREESSLGHVLHVKNMVLKSNINDTSVDQHQPTAPEFQTSLFTWTERLTAELPWNLTALAFFDRTNQDNHIVEGPTTPDIKEFNRTTSTSLVLTHRLYQSLVTNYSLNKLSMDTSSGEVTAKSDSLNSVYTKGLSFGRLTAGVQLSHADTERTGNLSIINEVHNSPLFGTFALSLRNVTESTISVQVTDPATNGLIALPPSGYIISLQGDRTQITITSLSPLVPQPDPFYIYTFSVSYSVGDQSSSLVRSWGYSARLDMIDNFLSVYYSYATSDQEFGSTMSENTTGKDTTEIVGMTMQSGSYSGLIEHAQYRSWQNPSETWKTVGEYRTPIADNTNLSARITYRMTDYFSSPSGPSSAGFSEKKLETFIMGDRRYPHMNLILFLTANYIRTRSYIASDSASINTYATWQIGLLTVTGGIQVYRTNTMIGSDETMELSQYYYVTVNRKIF